MRADALRQTLGDVAFGERGPILDARGLDEVDRVAVAAERAARWRDIVGEDPVAALARQLLAGVAHDVGGLGREADDETRPAIAACAQRLEDVRVLAHLEGRRLALLLDLLTGGFGGGP